MGSAEHRAMTRITTQLWMLETTPPFPDSYKEHGVDGGKPVVIPETAALYVPAARGG